jgi:hypothetical protein
MYLKKCVRQTVFTVQSAISLSKLEYKMLLSLLDTVSRRCVTCADKWSYFCKLIMEKVQIKNKANK